MKGSLVSITLTADEIHMHRADDLDVDEPFTPELLVHLPCCSASQLRFCQKLCSLHSALPHCEDQQLTLAPNECLYCLQCCRHLAHRET